MGKYDRATAKYVFANEIKNSNLTQEVNTGDNQYVSTHVITPTGQNITRVYICGTITEIDDVGTDTQYFRARLIDQTGSINVYAGDYQPEAVKVLSEIEPPAYIAVIGKVSMFTTPDGTIIPTIRAEDIAVVDKDTIITWTFMAARNWITHHEDDKIATEAKKMAKKHYGDVSKEYKDMIINVLESTLDIEHDTEENNLSNG